MVSRLRIENKTTLSQLEKLLKRLCVLSPGIFCVGIVTLCSFYASAQPSKLINRNIDFTKLPDELGLSQSSINCIIQDRNGYLWIATWSGLVRYDGYTTSIFHSGNEPGDIKSNLISTLFEDHAGNIWVGTHMSGLFLYNKRTNKFINYKHDDADPNSISSNNIWKIREDPYGNLWVATEYGLNFFNRQTHVFQSFFYDQSNPSSISGNFVTDVFFSHDGTLWIGTDRGVNKLVTPSPGNYSFEHFYYKSGDAGDNFTFAVEEVLENDCNVILFITNRGLNRIDHGKLQNLSYQSPASGCPLLRCMLKVNNENPFLLLGSAKGLNLFDFTQNSFTPSIGNFDNLGISVSRESIHITSLYMDRGGVLWVGTKKGLYKSDSYQKNFKLYLTSTFDKTNSIISGIETMKDGGYWISTLGGGLFTMKDEKFKHYRFTISARSYFADFIQTLFKDSRGTIWVGTAGAGVISFRPEDIKNSSITKFNHYYSESTPSINADYIVSFTEDKLGAIWIGTWGGGLIKILPDGQIVEYRDQLFTKAPLVVMHPDKNGDLWVGTRGNGIYRLHEKKNKLDVKHYFYEADSNGLCNDYINDITEDHSGRLWIGTEGGLMYYERSSDKFIYHTIKDGPSIKVIVSLLEDDRGKLWFSQWSGVTVIDPINKNLSYGKNFNKHDRIQGDFYFNNVCLKDPDGNLLFGGSNGLNIIDPEDILQNPLSPNILITQFKLSNKPLIQNELVNNRVLLKKPIDEADSIVLNYNENAISFEFAALDFAAPEKIQYAYKLEGFDADWIHTEAFRRYANYTNLNPGNYIFQVKAMNNDGLWSNNIRSLHILIRLPWWKTNWAMLLYAIIAVGVLLVLYKLLLIRTAYIHDIKIERLQRENAENLNKAKLQFFTNISHEFRTPLTLILAPVQSLIDSNNGGGNLERKYLLRIHNNAQRLLRLVNQLLDFRKTETGNLKLEVVEGNLVKFTKEIKLSFDSLAEKMKINFTFHSSAPTIKAWFDPDQFEKILFNLLSNAFKNTKEGAKISLQVQDHQSQISIIIEDNGKGIKQENLEKIFQSFFSYHENRHQDGDGTGIGLALVKSLVDAHHGTIQVESKEHEFTRFIVSISSGNSHFAESEIAKTNHDSEDVTLYPLLSPEILFDEDPKEVINYGTEPLPKMLVVEDNDEVREYIRTIFSTKYHVLEAENGKTGLHLAMEENPDIIISDVMMPLMDGITLCKTLKSHIATSHIPVILLTARTSLIFAVEGLETGADEYMSKPFSPKILQLKVRNLLRTREAFKNIFQDQKALQIEPRRVTLNSTDEKFVQEVLESIEKNISNTNYSVEVLNQEVGMSRTLLYKKLKALTGQSPIEFIRTIRLKRAAQLLEQNELTIAEITYLVGFQDLQYFRECFKKLFGVTPSEYSQASNKIENHDDA